MRRIFGVCLIVIDFVITESVSSESRGEVKLSLQFKSEIIETVVNYSI